ncbi:hypothetical protein AB1046_17645 [Promicromonospora sp. Populi]|uniref:hypothetical protein n=1 Tax=Promicromonospora sp. Populi TaxID=3239420 RepID=UPI0034E2002E
MPRHASGVAGASVPAPSGTARWALLQVSRLLWCLTGLGLCAFGIGLGTGAAWLILAGVVAFLTGASVSVPVFLVLLWLTRTGEGWNGEALMPRIRTTRRVNRRVIEGLETAVRTAARGTDELRQAAMAMDTVRAETTLHDDVAAAVNLAWANAADAGFELRARLAAERNGEH